MASTPANSTSKNAGKNGDISRRDAENAEVIANYEWARFGLMSSVLRGRP
jgi:hypothetical protein